MAAKDRKATLQNSGSWNGIDFVEVANDAQTLLRVHFINGVNLDTPVSPPVISGGETIPTVRVVSTAWDADGDHLVWDVTVAAPGDFSDYTLSLTSGNLDSFFASATFSFKTRCPSRLDCGPTTPACPPEDVVVPSIDYLAKDFLSFRQGLLDFSSLRYPEWQERSEADFGVMFAEALSALADDLSYMQDRIAAEAVLQNVTQRRSLVRLARLADYEPGRATASSAMLQFNVSPGTTLIPFGIAVSASGPDGTPIIFETGNGLAGAPASDAIGPTSVPVASSLWNTGMMTPYWLDDSQRCLPAGAVTMLIAGHGWGLAAGQSLLIDTQGAISADPPIRQIFQLVQPPVNVVPEQIDALFQNTPYTQIFWQQSDALLAEHDLTVTTLCGNLTPATQGQTVTPETFIVGAQQQGNPTAPTIVRTGPAAVPSGDCTCQTGPLPQHLYCLQNASRLTWLAPAEGSDDTNPLPEILLQQTSPGQTPLWAWVNSILDAEQFSPSFTLDDARYQAIAINSDGTTQFEYAGDQGDTLRFGTGTFGSIPLDGTIFQVSYRVGGGSNGNVASGAINTLLPGARAVGMMAVTNPLPAIGGCDAQTTQSVQRLAPQAFRAVPLRAAIPDDYQIAAETLPWVQRAGTTFRWTGSWLTIFTTPDPTDSEQITRTQQTKLIDVLNRYRMAGYESYVPQAQYISLDIEVQICADASAFRADVYSAVLARLDPSSVVNGTQGFFNQANFTFGTPLERSQLEAAIQAATGVAGILCIHYLVRGRDQNFAEMPDVVTVGVNQIIRCDNDPNLPDHGSIQVIILGGK